MLRTCKPRSAQTALVGGRQPATTHSSSGSQLPLQQYRATSSTKRAQECLWNTERCQKALLVGNGINLLEDTLSWSRLMDEISSMVEQTVRQDNHHGPRGERAERNENSSLMADNETIVGAEPKPFSLAYEEIYMRCLRNNATETRRRKGRVKEAHLKKKVAELIVKLRPNWAHKAILEANFDNILTTNYDYTFEEAVGGLQAFSVSPLVKEMTHSLFRMKERNIEAPSIESTSRCDHSKKLGGKSRGNRGSETRTPIADTHNKTGLSHDNSGAQKRTQRLWHIHGEANVPSSMVLGYDHYSGYLQKVRNYLLEGVQYKSLPEHFGGSIAPLVMRVARRRKHLCGEQHTKTPQEAQLSPPPRAECRDSSPPLLDGRHRPLDPLSWVDLFLCSDVHVLGSSMDLVEMHLWWLLVFRARAQFTSSNKMMIGNKVVYYTPSFLENRPEERKKLELLRAYNVQVKIIPCREAEWNLFYQQSIGAAAAAPVTAPKDTVQW